MSAPTSTLTCPACRAVSTEVMPTDACVHFFQCPACATMLHPKPGDCCVFCSYGTAKCPPRSMGADARPHPSA